MSAPRAARSEGAAADLDDIQGLVRFAYKHHTEASFLLLRITNPAAARAWLARAPVASAATRDPLPPTVLQVALSAAGLRALAIAEPIIAGFAAEFVDGIASDASRARRLGDIGANDPAQWRWGTGTRLPDVLVMLYALPGGLEAWQRTVEAQLADGFALLERLATSDMGGREPFGFVDGISQPELDWARRRPARDADRYAYENLSCLGEFLLGYPNEYGLYTNRPLLDPQDAGGALLPRAEDAPDKADLGRNGSYVVMRQLHQDVRGFWRTLDALAGGDDAARERLAATLVGRTLQGVPIVVPATAPADGAGSPDPNGFTYDQDPAGLRCPLGAHVRRANPRNADLPPGAPGPIGRLVRRLGFDAAALDRDRIASTRFHRLLRRGREYGAPLAPAAAAAPDVPDVPPADESGLHFICLAANITRQFEFVQSAWMTSPKFAGLRDQADPLLGHRLPLADGTRTDGYAIPRADAPDRRLCDLPRFVTVVGGAYFFLPGIRALRFLAMAR